MTLINEKQYFVESEKVVQIVKEKKEALHRQLPVQYRIGIAKDLIEGAKTPEEYRALKEQLKELEIEMKFDNGRIQAIPDEHQLKVAYNRVAEEEKLDEVLEKQKAALFTLVENFEKKLLPTLQNIAALEKRKLIGKKIDILLDGDLIKSPQIIDALGHANGLAFSGEEYRAKKAKDDASSLSVLLKQIATESAKPNGIKKPSIFKQLLGGNK